MTFGLRNAAQTFQRFINEVLRDLDFCYAYIDDVLVTSTLEEEHKQHLCTLFQHFYEYGVLLNPAKCVFSVMEVTFLGYTVSAAGTQPLVLARLGQRPQTFPWHAKCLPAVHTTSRQHTSITPRCVSWSQGQRIQTGGMDAHHGPSFPGLQG